MKTDIKSIWGKSSEQEELDALKKQAARINRQINQIERSIQCRESGHAFVLEREPGDIYDYEPPMFATAT
jgi:hypothetical protein